MPVDVSGYHALAPAQALDRAMGDPADPDNVLSYACSARLDASEEFPTAACAHLDALGVPRYYVPARHGGGLTSYEEVLHLMRALARRDLTLAIAHGKTFLGAVGVWVAGSPEQTAGLAADILAGARVCWGLTERAHGSDLLAGEVSAQRSPDGYRINGEKWLINNATQGDLVCLLARTDPDGGPRGFSLLLVDKRRLGPSQYQCLPKVRTQGIRAADISGISFHEAQVPATALVGAPGGGLEIIGKAFQLTRSCAAALSLGAADQGFGLVLGYLAERRLYGRTLRELPKVRADLGEAYAVLFATEALSVLASRAIHVLPGDLSVLSAVTKYLVPTLVDDLLGRLGEMLGARAFLSDVHAGGRFAKVERDHRIVGIFDGSTAVNLSLVVNQFPVLVRGYRRTLARVEEVAVAADLSRPVPEADLGRLSLLARHGCATTQALRTAVEELAKLVAMGEAPAPLLDDARALQAITDEVYAEMAATAPAGRDLPPSAFATAHRYALCVAGAACVHLWLANRSWAGLESAAVPWRDGVWVRASLGYLLTQLRPAQHPPRYPVFSELFDAVRPGAAPSLLPGGGGVDGR
jgi:alkylation response protein AidB-like acyl-CoA dehydrogenase